jgi:histidine ammonia-lyase
LAVEAVALMQAVDLRGISTRLAPSTRWMYNGVRKLFPYFKEDFSASPNLQQVKQWLIDTDVVAQFKKKI